MILLNDFKRQWEDTAAGVLAAVASVGESGWYVLGQHVADFEQAFAAMWGRRYAARPQNQRILAVHDHRDANARAHKAGGKSCEAEGSKHANYKRRV